MAIEYPSSIPTFPTFANGDIFDAILHLNDIQGELTALMTELGINPSKQFRNFLINGGFEFWQRGTSFTNPAVGVYGPDRWKVTFKGGSTLPQVDLTRVAAVGTSFFTSQFFNRLGFTVAGSADSKYELGSLIEEFDTYRSKFMTFSLDVIASVAGKVRLVISDTIGVSQSTFHPGSGSLERLSVTRQISNSASQFRCFVEIVPADFTGNVDIDNGNLSDGTGTRFNLVHPAEELIRCQRYFEKSYDIGVDPGTVTSIGAHSMVLAGSRGDQFIWENNSHFSVAKRAIPTVVLFSTVTGASGQVVIVVTDRASVASLVGQNRFTAINNTGGAIGAANQNGFFQWTADAEL